jgi:hypothetical protein
LFFWIAYQAIQRSNRMTALIYFLLENSHPCLLCE